MNNKLYIIGNGFDLNHKLDTRYSDFRAAHVNGNRFLKSLLHDIYGKENADRELWWKDLEVMLGQIDYNSLTKSRNGDAMASEKVKNLVDNLSLFFGNWIKSVDNKIDTNNLLLRKDIDKDALFFTFNYTMLLEKAYQISLENIWHIHGSTNDFAHDDKAIIVGHDSSAAQLIRRVSPFTAQGIPAPQIDKINQEIIKGAKHVARRIQDNEERFLKYSDVKHFIAMGFSFNDIDMPYIKKIVNINKNINDTQWTIYWHADGEFAEIKSKLEPLGISGNTIQPINW